METIEPTLTEREEFLSDIIITAVEGGIGYWSVCRNYKHEPRPASVEVRETETESGTSAWVKVNTAVVDRAIQKIINSGDGKAIDIHAVYVKQIAAAYATNDGGDIDAGLADIIVQVAVLGKVIYG